MGLYPWFLSCYGFVNRGSVKPDSIVCFLCLRSSMLSLTLRSCPPGEACAISLYGFLPYGNRRMPSVVLLFWRSADIIASFTVFEGSASDPCFSVSIIWYFPLREFSRVLGSTSFPALCGVSACVRLYGVRILQSVRRKKSVQFFVNFSRRYWQGISFVV